MTEEQRMEEGRRMFQIFAARMFEQRVLTAYREKVAQERQRKLLEELEEESKLDLQREQKKAKEAQKKKDKKRLQKQAKDEEKARKDAEKAAEEAAAKAIEEKKAEEVRQRKEQQRKKREAEKKALEEEKLRKEAEKQRRLQEERQRQADLERKQREQKEQEKRKREEAKKKEREEREAKESEAREKKEREERERRDKSARAKADRDAREKARREEHQAMQQAAATAAAAASSAPTVAPLAPTAKRPSQTASAVPAPPSLPVPTTSLAGQSPHLQIATPAIPKAPTPIRPRQTSQQGSVSSSPRTPQVTSAGGHAHAGSPVSAVFPQNSPGPIAPPGKFGQPQMPMHAPPGAVPSTLAPPPGMSHPTASGFAGMNGPPSSQPQMMPSLSQRASVSHELATFGHPPAPIGNQSRAFSAASGLPFHPGHTPMMPPGTSSMRPLPHGRGMFMDGGSTMMSPQQQNAPQQPPIGLPSVPVTHKAPSQTMPSHSRQQSASFDPSSFDPSGSTSQTQPIARPAPIQRPSSANRHRAADENQRYGRIDVDDLSNHLGSSALLDDTDEQFSPADLTVHRRGSAAPGPPGAGPRQRSQFGNFPPSSMFGHPTNRTLSITLDYGEHPADTRDIYRTQDGGTRSGQRERDGRQLEQPTASIRRTGHAKQLHLVARARYDCLGSLEVTSADSAILGWSNANAFGFSGFPHSRPSLSRPVNVRLLICQACKQLDSVSSRSSQPNNNNNASSDGFFHDVHLVLRQVDQTRPPNEAPIQMKEMLDICETEGDAQNGGGYFTIKHDAAGRQVVRYEGSDGGFIGSGAGGMHGMPPHGSARGSIAPGEIGSPMTAQSAFPGVSRPYPGQGASQPPPPGMASASPAGF